MKVSTRIAIVGDGTKHASYHRGIFVSPQEAKAPRQDAADNTEEEITPPEEDETKKRIIPGASIGLGNMHARLLSACRKRAEWRNKSASPTDQQREHR